MVEMSVANTNFYWLCRVAVPTNQSISLLGRASHCHGTMSVQVGNTGESYKIVGNNFEYYPLCRTIKSMYSRTILANMISESR